MTALWKGIWCEANKWTELSQAKTAVLIKLSRAGTLYIATTSGAAPPTIPNPDASPGTPEYDFGTIDRLKAYSGTFLGGSTSVFGWPAGATGLRVEVQAE